MTKLLDKALDTVRRLPAEAQDEIARALLDVAAGETGEEEVDPDDVPGLIEGLSDAEAGRFATDDHVEAAYKHFGR